MLKTNELNYIRFWSAAIIQNPG